MRGLEEKGEAALEVTGDSEEEGVEEVEEKEEKRLYAFIN